MKTFLSLLAAGATIATALAQDPPLPPPEEQIAAAVLAAPKDRRGGAGVLGYNAQKELVTLRPATNDLICLGDDPAQKGINVACYHKDLEPFMARGRELAKQYKGQQRHDARNDEVKAGKLKMPSEPRTLYVLTGSAFDPVKGEIANPYLRWVIYVPFATPESTGLSTMSSPSAPWLMYPGTAGAHIMISPPK